MGISDRYEHVWGVTSLDLNNDGLLDLVYGNWEGNHRMFVQKNGRFENIANKTFESKSKVRTVLSADFDNNGFEVHLAFSITGRDDLPPQDIEFFLNRTR